MKIEGGSKQLQRTLNMKDDDVKKLKDERRIKVRKELSKRKESLKDALIMMMILVGCMITMYSKSIENISEVEICWISFHRFLLLKTMYG